MRADRKNNGKEGKDGKGLSGNGKVRQGQTGTADGGEGGSSLPRPNHQLASCYTTQASVSPTPNPAAAAVRARNRYVPSVVQFMRLKPSRFATQQATSCSAA